MDKGVEILGWISSVVLVLTIGKQVHRQWKTGTSEGVSRWLFLGQCAAEIGFIAYSWMLRNWVFLFTNIVLLLESVVGYALVLRHRERDCGSSSEASADSIASAASGTRPSSLTI
jgi:uncharacterized protein with PQ loop repeat